MEFTNLSEIKTVFGSAKAYNKFKQTITESYDKDTLTDIVRLIDEHFGKQYYTLKDLFVKEKNNNQQTRFQYLSTGSMKLLNLLTKVIKAKKDNVQLLLVEELENSIHPRLLQCLLSSINDFLGETKLLFTSHSPNLAKYLSAPQLYVGLPSEKGLVSFHTLKATKVNQALKIAAAG